MSNKNFLLSPDDLRPDTETLRSTTFNSSLVEMKRTRLFTIEYPEILGLNNSTTTTHKASRPKYNFKRDEWADMNFVLYDLILPSTSKSIMDGLSALKIKSDKTITINICILDPSGVTIEKWNVIGEILEVDFGGLDYSEDKLLNVNINFKVKDAQLLF